MCGIAAILGRGGFLPARAQLQAMADALRHRGPDGEGIYLEGSVGFGFRRLSILDLSPEGDQPMTSADGRYVIVFNGEVYNYIELRDELRPKGYKFRSTGDTEVLLNAYAEWGDRCLDKLNGMWAFLIHDRKTGEVFGARDRFGVKPLYLCERPEALLLASELKAFAASGMYSPEVAWPTAAKYLLDGRIDDGPETFFHGVMQIPAGTAFRISADGVMRTWRYWALPETEPQSPPDAARRFADLFEDAVRLRLRSDVPVGVCLSGGLDSTAIICAMARQRETNPDAPLYAFSYTTPEFDETPMLEATVARTGATLVPLTVSGASILEDLPAVLRAQDEPMHSLVPLIGYELMRLARSHAVPVVLNGQGADETIGGYPTYFRYHWHELLSAGKPGAMLREIRAYTNTHDESASRIALGVLRHAMLYRLARLPGYRRVTGALRRREAAAHRWFTPALTSNWLAPPVWNGLGLNGVLAHGVEHSPLPLYLRIEDRNSMAHSVEVRLPFLDYRLVSFLFTLPAAAKLEGPWNKRILREAMRGRIPDVVRDRVQKFGFPLPTQHWMVNEMREPVRDMLQGAAAKSRGIYRIGSMLEDLKRIHEGQSGLTDALIRVVQFELWLETIRRPVAATHG